MRALRLALALAAALSFLAPFAAAKTDLALTATESGCAGTAFCFQTNATSVTPGEVQVTLTNRGQIPHNICFKSAAATLGCAPAGADTDGDGKTVPAGQAATVTFTAPASGTLEYWCNVSGHRQGGMSGTLAVQGAGASPPPSPPADGARSSPALGAASILLGVGLLALALRTRR